jgi:putative transposase
VTAQLVREGHAVNHKRVLRLMRERGILCRSKRRWVKTTDSEHGLRTYPNLSEPIRTYPNLIRGKKARDWSCLNQVWAADITYVRLPYGFCYAAAILDAFSRRVVGGHVSREMDAPLVLVALEKALAARRPEPGWVHHSDQGVQYACRG